MQFIYGVKDLINLEISKDIKEHAKIEIIDIYNSVSQEQEKDLYKFNLCKFGVIVLVEQLEELDNIFLTNYIKKYGTLKIKFVEERILEYKKIFIIKFINEKNKLVECIIDSEIMLKLNNYTKKEIEKNVKLIKKYNGIKLFL